MIVAANIRAETVFLWIHPSTHQISYTKDRTQAHFFTDNTSAALACAVFSMKFSVSQARVEKP